MMRQFFRTLPVELEEAARIDGASRLGVLVRIVLPLSAPALATLGVITFMWTWNDFLWPLITIYSEGNMTLQLGLTTFQGLHQTNTALLMAANVMSMVPILARVLLRPALVRARHRDVRAQVERRAATRASAASSSSASRWISSSVSTRARQPVERDGGVHELAAARAVGLDGARLHGDRAEVHARAGRRQVADVRRAGRRSGRRGRAPRRSAVGGRFVIRPVFGTLP